MKTLMFAGSANRKLGYVPDPHGKGIAAFRIDTDTGAAETLAIVEDIDSPTFVAIAPDGKSLASVQESAGAVEGKVSTFAIDAASGGLRPLGVQSSQGFTPAHLSYDSTGRFLATANYGDVPASAEPGKSVVVFRLGRDGAIGEAVASATFSGRLGPDKGRQDRPHAHCVRWTHDNRFLVVDDLGLDRLFVYRFDATAGTTEPHGEVPLPPGSGPRHFAIHPEKPFAYVVSELNSTLASFAFDAKTGEFKLMGVEPTVPAGGYKVNHCSGIAISPDGRHVFAANRGHDSLARFDIGSSGIARFIKTTPTGGKTPRDFAFDRSGSLVAVANQATDTIALFRYAGGNLTPLSTIATGSPTAIAFA